MRVGLSVRLVKKETIKTSSRVIIEVSECINQLRDFLSMFCLKGSLILAVKCALLTQLSRCSYFPEDRWR